MRKSYFRLLLGIAMGSFAGFSLATGIYPYIASMLAGVNSFGALIEIRPFVFPIVLIWAVGGGILGWQGGLKTGLLTFGTCGVVSGIMLGISTGGSAAMILTGLLCGLVYGGLGGLILGKAFAGPMSEEEV